MKNLLLLLVLANVLYFLWGMYQEAPPTPGSAIVNETDFGPPIEIAATPDAETVASVGAFLRRRAVLQSRGCRRTFLRDYWTATTAN